MKKDLEALIPIIIYFETMQDIKRLSERIADRRDYELQDRRRTTTKQSSEKDR